MLLTKRKQDWERRGGLKNCIFPYKGRGVNKFQPMRRMIHFKEGVGSEILHIKGKWVKNGQNHA